MKMRLLLVISALIFISTAHAAVRATIVVHGEIHGTPSCVRLKKSLAAEANAGKIRLYSENAIPSSYGPIYDRISKDLNGFESLDGIYGLESPFSHAIATFYQIAREYTDAAEGRVSAADLRWIAATLVSQSEFMLLEENPEPVPFIAELNLLSAGTLNSFAIEKVREIGRQDIEKILAPMSFAHWPPTSEERQLARAVQFQGIAPIADPDEVIVFRNDWMMSVLLKSLPTFDDSLPIHVILGASHVPHFQKLLSRAGYANSVDYQCVARWPMASPHS